MSELKYMNLSLEEILRTVDKNKSIVTSQEKNIEEFCNVILSAANRRVSWNGPSIFIGASGNYYLAKIFAMRLSELGFNVYLVGDVNMPPLKDRDIVIILSKSGKSNSFVQVVQDSKIDDISFLSICAADSYLSRISDASIVIKPHPQPLVKLDDEDVFEFMFNLNRDILNFEMDDETKSKIESLPLKSVDYTSRSLNEYKNELPEDIKGILNIYYPLELLVSGSQFDLVSFTLINSIITRLMYRLNLREGDLIEYRDVFHNIDFKKEEKYKDKKVQKNSTVKSKLVPGEGRIPFPAYEGSEPFIFVSYAHIDSNRVFPDIKRFHDQGYNIWYDEGIAPGNEWLSDILEHLKKCDLYIIFVSNNSVKSSNVKKEFKYAISKKKNILPIYLDDFDNIKMDDEWEYELQNIQGILKTTLDEEEYVYKYSKAFSKFGFKLIDNADDSVSTIIKEKTYKEYGVDDFVDINLDDYEKPINKINVLALNENLKNLNNLKSIIASQSEAICKFRDIIVKAKTYRTNWNPKTIHIMGEGNLDLISNILAVRLLHLGFDVNVFSDSSSKPVNNDDILIIFSKSSEINPVFKFILKTDNININLLAICKSDNYELIKRADASIVIDPLPQKFYNLKFDENYDDILFMLPEAFSELHDKDVPLEMTLNDATLELTSHVFIYALFVELMYTLNLREKDLRKYHDVLTSSI